MSKKDLTTKPEEIDLDDSNLNDIAISDTHLAEEDKKTEKARRDARKTAKKIRTPEEKKKLLYKKIFIACLAVVLVFVALLSVPSTRWPILNAVGFRGTLVITVEENNTQNQVEGATVSIENGIQKNTDTFGRASFENVSLGRQQVTVQKVGYGDLQEQHTVELGTTNKRAALKIIGIKLELDVIDWLSGSSIQNAVVSYQDLNATSDKSGRASIVIPPTDEESVALEVSAPSYLTRTITTEISIQSREVTLVAAEKNYFMSKREGKFDIFSSNLDGSDQRKIIEATGKEEESLLQFTIHRNNAQAILVANRDGRVQNGRVVAGVYVVDLANATFKKIDEGSDIQILGWTDSAIAYTKSAVELTYDDPALSRVMSYNIANSRLVQIAQSNYFANAVAAQNKIFYTPADAYRPTENASLTSHDMATGGKRTYIADRQVGYVTRANYNILELQDVNGANFELQISSGTTRGIDRSPQPSKGFSVSPNGLYSIWTERRDGKGTLLLKNIKENDERVVLQSSGLTNPARYVSDSLAVVRVVTSQETADYIVNTNSGKIRKIVDVSNIPADRSVGL